MVEEVPSEIGGPKQIKLRFGGTATLDRVVDIGMPKSLPELQHLAAQNFGHSGCLRLFHHGTTLLYHPAQMSQIQDGDYIIVRKSESMALPSRASTPRSTHQADFHKRPFQKPRGPACTDEESTLTELSRVPFDGTSRYTQDFTRHPIEEVVPYKPPSAIHLTNALTGTTTYSREFPWRESSSTRRALVDDRDLRKSSLSEAAHSARFHGTSSYTIDYPRHEPAYVQGLANSAIVDSLKGPPSSFNAVSTYATDFKHLGRGRQRSAKPKPAYETSTDPFNGTSEYRREYHELSMNSARNMFVKLASEQLRSKDGDDMIASAKAAATEGESVEFEVPPAANLKQIYGRRPQTAA